MKTKYKKPHERMNSNTTSGSDIEFIFTQMHKTLKASLDKEYEDRRLVYLLKEFREHYESDATADNINATVINMLQDMKELIASSSEN